MLGDTADAKKVLGLASVSAASASADEAVARDAASACRERFSTDYALAVGPFPAAELDASGKANEYYFALATADKVICRTGTLISHPSIWKPRAAKQALNCCGWL